MKCYSQMLLKDAMYLAPLQSILQLRPSFEHLSAADDAKKKLQQEEMKAEEDDGEEETEARKSTPISVRK